MSREKEFVIVINGTEHEVAGEVITYDNVVTLAFPSQPVTPEYAVTFEHAQHPKKGTLASGGSVTVKKHGTIFDVTPTNRS